MCEKQDTWVGNNLFGDTRTASSLALFPVCFPALMTSLPLEDEENVDEDVVASSRDHRKRRRATDDEMCLTRDKKTGLMFFSNR
mgnify:CR=1 FL=1